METAQPADEGRASPPSFASESHIDGLDVRLAALARTRRSLLRAYLLHVVWFVTMCTFAGLHWNEHGLKWSVFLTLGTVPPVLYYTVRTHTLCRAIDTSARTVGLVPVIVTTLVLSPFESGLILPLKNMLAANRVLRQARFDNGTSPCPERERLG